MKERIEIRAPHVGKRWLGAATAMVLLSGCMVGPDYQRPPVTAPDVFRGSPVPTAPDAPQFGLLLMLVLLPLQILSGVTPRESMPVLFVQFVMLAAPTTHFVRPALAILYRGAGLTVVWPQFIALAVIGAALFYAALTRFRKTIGTMA
jgi:hypothetical protein